MRLLLPARLVLIVALIAALIPALSLVMPPSPLAAAAPAAQTADCVEGTDLILNGSFERPGLGGADEVLYYAAEGWPRATWGYSATSERAVEIYQIPADGNVVVDIVENPIAQSIDVSRYAGASLALSLVASSRSSVPNVTFADRPVALTRTGSNVSGSVQLPRGATGRATLVFRPGEYGAVIDNVRLVVTDCGVIPNAAPVFAPGADTDQALEATGPSGASGYTVPTATDTDAVTAANPGGAVPVTCNPAPTADFAVDSTTPITCTATDTVPDGADELDTPVRVTFDVTVQDTTAPDLDETSLPGASVDGVRVLQVPATGLMTPATWDPIIAIDLVDGELTLTCTPASGTAFEVGDTPGSCSIKDGAGNEVTTSFTVRVTDDGDPIVSFASPPATVEATGPDGAPVAFTVSATDAVDGALTPDCTTGTPSRIITSGDTLALGTHSVTCTAEDSAGNTGEASFTVSVEDTTAPVITVPSVAPIVADGPYGAIVTFDVPTATDIVTPALEVTCDYDSGDRFAIGDTPVTCTTEDTAGNEAEATVIVTVTSATNAAPTFAPAANTNQTLEATGPDGAAGVDIPVATDADASGLLTVTCVANGQVITATTVLPITISGPITVTCTAADVVPDGAYQLPDATVTFDVTVEDTTAPVVAVPGDITVDGGTGDRAQVSFAAPTATDSVDGPITTVTCVDQNGRTISSGVTLAVGTWLVTCSATDSSDQTGTATFTITVRDTSGPTGIIWVGGPLRNATYTTANVPAAPTCTAIPTGSQVLQCRVTGYSSQPGIHIMTARARDYAGNVTVETRTYTVTAGTTQPTVTPRPTTPVVTPAPTTPPTAVPTRPGRTPVATPTPAPTQPPVGPTRPPRR